MQKEQEPTRLWERYSARYPIFPKWLGRTASILIALALNSSCSPTTETSPTLTPSPIATSTSTATTIPSITPTATPDLEATLIAEGGVWDKYLNGYAREVEGETMLWNVERGEWTRVVGATEIFSKELGRLWLDGFRQSIVANLSSDRANETLKLYEFSFDEVKSFPFVIASNMDPDVFEELFNFNEISFRNSQFIDALISQLTNINLGSIGINPWGEVSLSDFAPAQFNGRITLLENLSSNEDLWLRNVDTGEGVINISKGMILEIIDFEIANNDESFRRETVSSRLHPLTGKEPTYLWKYELRADGSLYLSVSVDDFGKMAAMDPNGKRRALNTLVFYPYWAAYYELAMGEEVPANNLMNNDGDRAERSWRNEVYDRLGWPQPLLGTN